MKGVVNMIFCNVENCKNNNKGTCTIIINIENGECACMDIDEEIESEDKH
jgi:hypothetical protein